MSSTATTPNPTARSHQKSARNKNHYLSEVIEQCDSVLPKTANFDCGQKRITTGQMNGLTEKMPITPNRNIVEIASFTCQSCFGFCDNVIVRRAAPSSRSGRIFYFLNFFFRRLPAAGLPHLRRLRICDVQNALRRINCYRDDRGVISGDTFGSCVDGFVTTSDLDAPKIPCRNLMEPCVDWRETAIRKPVAVGMFFFLSVMFTCWNLRVSFIIHLSHPLF